MQKSRHDYAPHGAKSRPPASRERGGGFLRPGVGSPFKILALALFENRSMSSMSEKWIGKCDFITDPLGNSGGVFRLFLLPL